MRGSAEGQACDPRALAALAGGLSRDKPDSPKPPCHRGIKMPVVKRNREPKALWKLWGRVLRGE